MTRTRAHGRGLFEALLTPLAIVLVASLLGVAGWAGPAPSRLAVSADRTAPDERDSEDEHAADPLDGTLGIETRRESAGPRPPRTCPVVGHDTGAALRGRHGAPSRPAAPPPGRTRAALQVLRC